MTAREAHDKAFNVDTENKLRSILLQVEQSAVQGNVYTMYHGHLSGVVEKKLKDLGYKIQYQYSNINKISWDEFSTDADEMDFSESSKWQRFLAWLKS